MEKIIEKIFGICFHDIEITKTKIGDYEVIDPFAVCKKCNIKI